MKDTRMEGFINSLFSIINKAVNSLNEYDLQLMIGQIFETFVSMFEIDRNLISGVSFSKISEKNSDVNGAYNSDTKTLELYTQAIESEIEDQLKEYSFLSSYEKKVYFIMNYVKTLIHELYHVYQNKIYSQCKNKNIGTLSLEEQTIVISTDRDRFFYCVYYSIDPRERVAELTAREVVLKVLSKFEDVTMLITIAKKDLLVKQISSYFSEKTLEPTLLYIEQTHPEISELIRESSKDLSLDKRIFYGLTLSEKELKQFLENYKFEKNEINKHAANNSTGKRV